MLGLPKYRLLKKVVGPENFLRPYPFLAFLAVFFTLLNTKILAPHYFSASLHAHFFIVSYGKTA